jgi:hypothetical protein
MHGILKVPFAGGCKNDLDAGFQVTFPEPMPDADYTLQVTFVDPHGLGQWFTVRQRTTKGFAVAYHRPRYVEVAPVNESLSPCEVEVHWRAEPAAAA